MNEQAIQDSYNVFVSQGYTKSIDEFKKLINTNPQALKDSYDVFVNNGYSKSIDDYKALMGVSSKPAPVLKKKASSDSEQSQQPQAKAMASSSEDGLSVTPVIDKNRFSLTQEDLKKIGKKQPTDMSGKPLLPKPAESQATFNRIEEERAEKRAQEKKYGEIFDKQVGTKPKPAESSYLKERLKSIDTDLINYEQDYIVPELEYQFGDLGFKFEESGIIGDYVKVTAPNNKTIEISADNLFSSKSKEQADVLKKFIAENTPAKGLFVIENTMREQDVKFNSQKQVDESIKSITNDVNLLSQRQKEILERKAKLDKDIEDFNLNPTQERLNILQQQKAQLDEDVKKVLQEESSIQSKGLRLNQAVAKYGMSKARQGSWYGGIWDSFNRGVGKMTSGVVSLVADIAIEATPTQKLMSEKDLKTISVDIAKKIGIKGPSENQTIDQWKATLTEDQLDEWEDQVDDYAKKDVKGKILPYVRIGAEEIFGDPSTTKQWADLKKEGFWGGAILGVAESLPAMIGGGNVAGWAQRTAQMYAQISDGLSEEMENDPDFKNITENEKLAITLPIGITSAVLEAYGLRNVMASKGVINSIALRAMGKAGVGTSAKTFRELVQNEVDGMVAKGLLTITAAGVAEFETGAAQELTETGYKIIYDKLKEKDMFNTPDSKLDLVENVLVAGAQEAVGGFLLGIPSGVSVAYSKKGFLAMDDNTFETFASMANDTNIQSAYIASLKQKITQGLITQKEAKEQLNDYRNSVGLYRQLPEGLTTQQKKEAMNLLKEKRDLENFVEGKDNALVVRQKNRITEINDSLTKLSETDAVQEQSTTEVPVQSETGISETMEGRTPEAEPEVATAEKEIADAKQKIEDERENELRSAGYGGNFNAEWISERLKDAEENYNSAKNGPYEDVAIAQYEWAKETKRKIDEINSKYDKQLKDLEKPEGLTEEQAIINAKPEEEVAPSPKISEALNDPSGVYVHDGKKGQLKTIGKTLVLETPTEVIDIAYDLDNISDQTLEDLGISQEGELDFTLNEDNSIELNGKKYVNNYSNPESAISQDKDGNYSVTLDTENGQKRTFRGQQAEQIAYQMKLKNFEQNGTEQEIDTAIELADEAIRIEEETREPSTEREGKTVRKGKRKQRTLKQPKEPLTKAEREASIVEGPPPVPEGYDIVTETAPVAETTAEEKSLLEESTEKVDSIKDNESFDLPDGSKIIKEGDSFKWDRNEKGIRDVSREEAIRIANNRVSESKAGQNISLKDYDTEIVNGNELKVGDVYVRDENGTRYVYRLLEKPRAKSGPGSFWIADVEVLSIGNQPTEVLTQEPSNEIGKVSEQERRVGKNTSDRFKSPSKDRALFGKVKKINNWEEASKPTETKTEVAPEAKAELTIDEQMAQYIDEANSYQDEMDVVEKDNSLTEEQKDSKINELEKKYMEALRKSNALAFEKARNKPTEAKAKPTTVEAPKKPSNLDKRIEEAEKDVEFYSFKIEDIEEEIKNEASNTKEEIADLKQKIEEVKKDTSLSRAEKKEAVEDLKAEIENVKENQEDVINDLKNDLKEAKSEYKKALSKIDKLLAKKETAPTEELNDLLDVDTKDKAGLKRVVDFLDEADKLFDINPNELNDFTRVMTAATAKAVIKTLKALVNAGITLQEAIERAAEAFDIKSEQIIDALDIVSKINENKSEGISEMELPGYNKLSRVIDGAIANGKTIDNILSYIERSDVYKNATDVQKELLVREVRKKFGLKEKSAPSVGKLFGKIKDIKKITMTEKDALVKQIRDKARGAKDAIKAQREFAAELAKEVKELQDKGKITVKQAANIISKFSKVNVFSDSSVSNFIDYMSKIFADADYDNKISIAKSKLKNAKKNIATKIGIANGLVGPLQRLMSINPNLIPSAYLNRYLELVNMFAERKAVLTLEEIGTVTNDVNDILDEINNEQSLLEELTYRFENSPSLVSENGVVSYSETIADMLKNNEITQDEADLMKKYKSTILPRVSKPEMTEQEIQDEKDALVAIAKRSQVNTADLPTRAERDLAKKLASLIKTNWVNSLSNLELQNLLKVIDNINNGYLPHYAQLISEKIESLADGALAEGAIKKSKFPQLSTLYAKLKSKITRKDYVLEMIRRSPLEYIDQVFGDFKTKDLFNGILKKSSEAEAKFTSEMKAIHAKLRNAEYNIAKSFNFNGNSVVMSKFKMMTYMIQLEYESNKDSSQVNPASEYLKKTIEHINSLNTRYNKDDAKMLESILSDYSTDGEIDINKLYNSFNKAEKAAIKTIRGINESLTETAQFTASVIRGQKMNPLNNYVHLNTLADTREDDLNSGQSLADSYNNSLQPSTKAKSLIERTKGAKPLNFDIFASAERGAKYVLMDYHLTGPIRTARKAINKAISAIEQEGPVSEDRRRVMNAVRDAFKEAVSNLVNSSYMETSFGEQVADEISKQGYRAVLASTGRFASEFLSNVGFVLFYGAQAFSKGLKHFDVMMSDDAVKIMSNLNSKEINRIFPSDTLSGRMIDQGILNQTNGISRAKSKGAIRNRASQAWNLIGKKYKNRVELISDILITTPDKAIMRPVWFGNFASEFEKLTGREMTKEDFNKIAENNEQYMDANKEILEKAKTVADEKSVITGASSNAFTGILKGTSSPNKSGWAKAFNNFNSFMTRFLIYEYTSARTGINAAVGNGTMSKKEGAALLAAVTTRMTVYSLLTKALGGGLIGLLASAGDDDEEEEKKSLEKATGQALASTFTSLIFGRDFGNATKTIINYGIEKINENHLQALREGEYDLYEDQIQYTAVPVAKGSKTVGLYDYAKNMAGAFGPAINTTDLAIRTYFGEDKKEADAQERRQKEKEIRVPLEIAGNLGFIPLYKEIRKAVMKDIYKDLSKPAVSATAYEDYKEAKEEKVVLDSIIDSSYDQDIIDAAEKKKKELMYKGTDYQKAINNLEKEKKKELLVDPETGTKYDNEEDLKKYNRTLWEQNFGPNSDWEQEHKYEDAVDKMIRDAATEKEERKYNYVKPK